MLYHDFMNKVKEIALITDESTGVVYIKPDYEYVLASSDISLRDVSDFTDVTRDIVCKQLELERDMRNAKNNKTLVVAQWLYDVITTVVEPSIIEEQNALVKDMIEYRKERNAIDTRMKDLNQKEKELEEKSKISPLNIGLNFSKRTP